MTDESRRPPPLFGRSSDLLFVKGRAHQQGLTAVAGRPQIGKSRLLRQLCEDLSTEFLVGYAESTGETADLFLRGLSDLYSRWLVQASYREQLKMIYDQQKRNLTSGTGGMIAKVIDKVISIAQPAVPVVGEVVREGLSSLLDFNKELKSGGIELPRLSYEQSRDLVGTLATLDQKPICLVLDAWEQSPVIKLEAALIESYLAHLEDWPASFHIFLGVRDDPDSESALNHIRKFKASSAAAAVFELGKMHLQDDRGESERLLRYLNERVPVSRTIDENGLLDLLDGYPGILQRWLQGQPTTEGSLIQLAADAQNYKYRELDELLGNVLDKSADLRTLAIRVAIFPQIVSQSSWKQYRSIILHEVSEDFVLDLASEGVLEDAGESFPSYGHAKRHEAARDWFATRQSPKNPRPYARREAEYLVAELTRRTPRFNLEAWPFLQALASLPRVSLQLGVADEVAASCIAAKSLLRISLDSHEKEILRKCAELAVKNVPSSQWLIEAGLLNAMVGETTDGFSESFDVLLSLPGAGTDELLGKMVAAHATYGDVGPPDTEEEDRELNSLRERLAQEPEDEEVTVQLALAIHKAFMEALKTDNRTRTRALSSEAFDLTKGQPWDSKIHKILWFTETDMGW